MRLLLIDLECTCCDMQSIPRESMEMIEIGAVVGELSESQFKTIDICQLYIQPEDYPQLTAFCTELTGISQLQVDAAEKLPAVLLEFAKWLDEVRPQAWGSWGKFDLRHFTFEVESKRLENPLINLQHFNIKQLFSRIHKHRVGLARAVMMSKLEFVGRHHSGVDDARNIANILAHDLKLRQAVLKRAV
ncbi:3'-5' exonuclease [Pelagibaculum spongiae]|uniref:3'-5' exonuclease n=1 Tax=Pelagibaculum spongiae TaxID=2080658 RepID=UPI001057E737|nr:3'-5' exonuclease [Pelagibaculum spongiae]